MIRLYCTGTVVIYVDKGYSWTLRVADDCHLICGTYHTLHVTHLHMRLHFDNTSTIDTAPLCSHFANTNFFTNTSHFKKKKPLTKVPKQDKRFWSSSLIDCLYTPLLNTPFMRCYHQQLTTFHTPFTLHLTTTSQQHSNRCNRSSRQSVNSCLNPCNIRL